MPTKRSVGRPRNTNLEGACLTDVNVMRLVVVLLFPFKVTQGDALMNPTQFRSQHAFHSSRMLRPCLVRHALSVGLSDRLTRHSAVNLTFELNVNLLPHPRVHLFSWKCFEHICTAQCIGNLAVLVRLRRCFQLPQISFPLHDAKVMRPVALRFSR